MEGVVGHGVGVVLVVVIAWLRIYGMITANLAIVFGAFSLDSPGSRACLLVKNHARAI